jgi:hypothetical protein
VKIPLLNKSFVGAILVTLVGACQVHAQTIVADYTLNQGTGFGPSMSSPKTPSGTPNDSVGNYYFETGYGNGVASFGTSSIGGPSNNPSFFSGGGGYYNTNNGYLLPTNDFSISLYTEVPTTADLALTGTMISTNSHNAGGIQIGIKGGNFVAILDDGTGNLVGTTLGSFAATSADAHLTLTDVNGTYVFTDNGVVGSSVTPFVTNTFSGFSQMHVGVGPGASQNFTGYLSDYTISSGVDSLPVPEPSTYALLGLGFLGLAAMRRFRRSNA